jgi:hypothetical protein
MQNYVLGNLIFLESRSKLFGVGGTNVHLVVEEYPIKPKVSGHSRPYNSMWSASDNSLKGYETKLGVLYNPNQLQH